MTIAVQRPLQTPARASQTARARAVRIAGATLLVPAGLFVLAVVVRFWVAAQITFPLTEGSAYYVAVARNLVTGHGLVIDALWSYATPPLILPRPAFELWQPMASFVAATGMALAGPTFSAAQLANGLVGALLASLAWLIGRDAAHRLGLPAARSVAVAVGSGLLVAIGGPFLLASAVPDSTAPFAVLGVAACILMPAAVRGQRAAMVGLGGLLGLAYLTRMEAVYLGVTLILLAIVSREGVRVWLPRIGAVAAVAALVAVPWWIRNALVFGSPFPGQVADNVFLTHNEQIFGYTQRPTLAAFLGQGLPGIIGNIATAAWHDVVDVLLVPAAPVVLIGAAALALWLVRRHGPGGPLAALLISGGLTLVATTVVFPVATLWGTFEHASGPLLVGLCVAAVLAGDSFVAWIGAHRGWQRNNAWMAALALVALTVPLSALQLVGASAQASDEALTVATVSGDLTDALAAAAVPPTTPIITNRPIWLSQATQRAALALPRESEQSILSLASTFGARAIVVFSDDPALFRIDPSTAACFTEVSFQRADLARVYAIDTRCVP
jgi:hypothetical protein